MGCRIDPADIGILQLFNTYEVESTKCLSETINLIELTKM